MNKHKISFRIFLFAISILGILFNNCSSPVEDDINYSYKMFYLKDSTFSYLDAESLSINKLTLEANPFLTEKNIKRFEVLYLDDNPIQTYHIILDDSVEVNLSNEIRPFIIILNGDRFCIADYWPSFLSIMPQGIHMVRMSDNFLWLNPGNSDGNSILKNPDIIEALKNLDIEIKYIDIGGNQVFGLNSVISLIYYLS